MTTPVQVGSENGAYNRTVTSSLYLAPSVGATVVGIGAWKTDSDEDPTLVTITVSDNQGGVDADYTQVAHRSLQRSGTFIVWRKITAPVVGDFEMTMDMGAGWGGPNVRLVTLELPLGYTLGEQSSDGSGQFDGGAETIDLTAGGPNPAGELIAFATMTPRADGEIFTVANNPPTGFTHITNRFFEPAPLVSGYKSISAPETTEADFGAVTWNSGRLGAKLVVLLQESGGGGTTYNDSLTETIAAGASQGAAAVFANTRLESVAAGVAEGSTAVFPATRTESIAAGDQFAGAAIFVGSLTESITAGDTRAVQAVFASAYTESVTPADARVAQAVFASAYAETVAAADSHGGAQTFVASLTNSVTLSDQYSAGGSTTYNEVISESLALADSFVASHVMAAALTESTALTDALAAAGIYGASLSESVSAGDALGASVVFSASLAEAIALADAMGASQIMLSAVGETINMAASFDATVTIPGGYPDPADVREGVSYGPTGIEYVGTFKGGKGMVWIRRR